MLDAVSDGDVVRRQWAIGKPTILVDGLPHLVDVIPLRARAYALQVLCYVLDEVVLLVIASIPVVIVEAAIVVRLLHLDGEVGQLLERLAVDGREVLGIGYEVLAHLAGTLHPRIWREVDGVCKSTGDLVLPDENAILVGVVVVPLVIAVVVIDDLVLPTDIVEFKPLKIVEVVDSEVLTIDVVVAVVNIAVVAVIVGVPFVRLRRPLEVADTLALDLHVPADPVAITPDAEHVLIGVPMAILISHDDGLEIAILIGDEVDLARLIGNVLAVDRDASPSVVVRIGLALIFEPLCDLVFADDAVADDVEVVVDLVNLAVIEVVFPPLSALVQLAPQSRGELLDDGGVANCLASANANDLAVPLIILRDHHGRAAVEHDQRGDRWILQRVRALASVTNELALDGCSRLLRHDSPSVIETTPILVVAVSPLEIEQDVLESLVMRVLDEITEVEDLQCGLHVGHELRNVRCQSLGKARHLERRRADLDGNPVLLAQVLCHLLGRFLTEVFHNLGHGDVGNRRTLGDHGPGVTTAHSPSQCELDDHVRMRLSVRPHHVHLLGIDAVDAAGALAVEVGRRDLTMLIAPRALGDHPRLRQPLRMVATRRARPEVQVGSDVEHSEGCMLGEHRQLFDVNRGLSLRNGPHAKPSGQRGSTATGRHQLALALLLVLFDLFLVPLLVLVRILVWIFRGFLGPLLGHEVRDGIGVLLRGLFLLGLVPWILERLIRALDLPWILHGLDLEPLGLVAEADVQDLRKRRALDVLHARLTPPSIVNSMKARRGRYSINLALGNVLIRRIALGATAMGLDVHAIFVLGNRASITLGLADLWVSLHIRLTPPRGVRHHRLALLGRVLDLRPVVSSVRGCIVIDVQFALEEQTVATGAEVDLPLSAQPAVEGAIGNTTLASISVEYALPTGKGRLLGRPHALVAHLVVGSMLGVGGCDIEARAQVELVEHVVLAALAVFESLTCRLVQVRHEPVHQDVAVDRRVPDHRLPLMDDPEGDVAILGGDVATDQRGQSVRLHLVGARQLGGVLDRIGQVARVGEAPVHPRPCHAGRKRAAHVLRRQGDRNVRTGCDRLLLLGELILP